MAFSTHEVSKRNSSYSYVWLTPQPLIAALGPFDLDPCAAPFPQPWPTATAMITEADGDGLLEEWNGRVWLNPPYSSIAPWMEKMARHGNGIALISPRTDTNWFHDWVAPAASGLFFFRRRIRFHRPDGSLAGCAGAPSILVAYGEEEAKTLASFDWPGFFVPVLRDQRNLMGGVIGDADSESRISKRGGFSQPRGIEK